MTTPKFWREACFSVAETADRIGSTEVALRTWLARNPLEEFAGTKQNGRLWLTGRDGYFYCLVQVLAAFGVPVRTAMYAAGSIASYGPPTYRYLIVETKGGKTTFRASVSPDVGLSAVLLIPLRDMYEKHLAACRSTYVTEGA